MNSNDQLPDGWTLLPPQDKNSCDDGIQQTSQDWQLKPVENSNEPIAVLSPEEKPISSFFPKPAFPSTHRRDSTVTSIFVIIITSIILISGIGVSWYYHTKNEKLLKETDYLKSKILTLTNKTNLLQKTYEPVQQTAEAISKATEDEMKLGKILEARKKEVEAIQQEYFSTLSKLEAARKTYDSIQAKVKVVNQESQPTQLNIPTTKTLAEGEKSIEQPNPNPDPTQMDVQMVQRATTYLKARQTGDIVHLAQIFAPVCNYQYANGKASTNEFIMNDIRKFWDKYPTRSYQLLKVAYSGNSIEIIYFYKCSNQSGKTLQGYTKEMWQTSPSGQIVQWNEVLNSKTPPDTTPNYRNLRLNR